RHGEPHPDEMSELVAVANLVLVRVDLAAAQPLDLVAVEEKLFLGHDVLEPEAEQLVLLVAADPAQRGIDADEASVEADDPDPDRGVLKRAAEPLLALAQRVVGPAWLRHLGRSSI